MLKGLWVRRFLLKGLKPAVRYRSVTVYDKPGDVQDMIYFYFVGPTDIRDLAVCTSITNDFSFLQFCRRQL